MILNQNERLLTQVHSRRQADKGKKRSLPPLPEELGKTITEDRRLSHPDKEITLYELRLGTAYATARRSPRLHLTSAAQLRDVHAHQSKTRSPTLPILNEGGLDYDTNDRS